jgi:hypothetical protein
MNSPTAWVYLHQGDCTIRWQRGDTVAYVFEGRQLESYPDETLRIEILATIPVSPKGWTDLTHVRRVGEHWVKAKRKRCQVCGVYS